MTTFRPLTAAVALVAAAVLAACSSSATGSPAQPPANTRPTTGHSAPTGSSPAGTRTTTATSAGSKLDVCAALPAATVAQLTGAKVTKGESQELPQAASMSISTCNYTGGLNQLDITVTRSSLAAQLFQDDYSANKQVLSKTAMVSGIGDKAFTANFPSMWLEVLWGDEQLEISGASTVPIDAAKRVLTALHDKA
jgi:hypothetical protein